MANRTLQRLLGETSLERKCLLFFGTSLFLLIIGSFWWYGGATIRLIYENTRSNCRTLIVKSLVELHAGELATNSEFNDLRKELNRELEMSSYSWSILCEGKPPVSGSHFGAPDSVESRMLADLRATYQDRLAQGNERPPDPLPGSSVLDVPDPAQVPPIYDTPKDALPIWKERRTLASTQYYQVVQWKESCVICHAPRYGIVMGDRSRQEVLPELPFMAVKVTLPFSNTQRAINRMYAIALAIAIITVFLAVLALYFIVRFLIVKPVQHLRNVSEQVEQGNYQARAEIETQDELEDLAHAFNGMLRHLVEAQTKLTTYNTELDAKVDQLAQANMKLYEMNRLKSDFLANISHELRTPLNSIIGFSEVLQGIESLNDKQKRYVSYIRRSGRGLLDMINDILDLAKMESGKMEVRLSEFFILPVVQEQCDFVRSLAEEKNIDVSVECTPDLPPLVQDQAKVGQILTNLLSNAIKFTPDGGYIRVVIRPEGSRSESDALPATPLRLTISVIDTGIGIAKEDQDSIFEKFRQAGTLRGDNLTREFSGTGLGLSIVRELCNLLHGHVSVRSELGRGSTFVVDLPWHLSAAAATPLDLELTDTRSFSERSRLAARKPLLAPAHGEALDPREPLHD